MHCRDKRWRRIAVLAVVFVVAGASLAGPPRVVRTSPENGERAVDPRTSTIRIMFDQAMSQGGGSVCGGGESFPELVGRPGWANDRTFIMRVRLKAEHDYSLSVNCQSYQNFRGISGEAAVITPISFRTGSASGESVEREDSRPAGASSSSVSPADNAAAIAALRQAIEERYSYRDLRQVDWEAAFAGEMDAMLGAASSGEFAQAAARVLAPARDVHLWLEVGGEHIATFRRSVSANFDRGVVEKIVPEFMKRSRLVCTGRFPDGIGYVLIESWEREHAEALEQAYVALWEFADAPGMIVDVRPNAGGAEPLAQEVAGCFLDGPVVYAGHVYRDAGAASGFTAVQRRIVEPNKKRPRFRGPVAVLMGPGNMSSCEAFLLMMKQVGACTLVGQRSYGSSGNPKPVDLGNGVRALIPSWKSLGLDGSCFEGQGLEPDVVVEGRPDAVTGRDPVIEAALEELRE